MVFGAFDMYFYWDGEFMAMGCSGSLCWQWIMRGGCACGWLFLLQRGERKRHRERIKKKYLNEVVETQEL